MSADITKPETWYGLKLGEIVWFTENSNLQRVPGGWMMYTVSTRGRGDVETFIPYNPEFDQRESQACNDKRYIEKMCPIGGLL